MNNKNPLKAYLFDIDGVLTDPETKKIEQLEILIAIMRRLERGYPIGLNTGRSLESMIEQVLKPLEEKITNRQLLQRLFAIGEKGGVWITYDVDGFQKAKVDKDISVPKKIQDRVRMLMNISPYKESVFYDNTKQTMISVELKSGISVREFQRPQKQLTKVLKKLLINHGLEEKLKVDPTRIATDIESIHVGKALGARKYIELLKEKSIDPQGYLTFGDSKSDYDMYEELLRFGKRARLIFVGGKKHLTGKVQKGIEYTSQPLDKGTLAFLQSEEIFHI